MVDDLLLDVGMPSSVRRFVCDLLDAIDEPCPSSALLSLDEALWDLTQMRNDPDLFLFDGTCPRRALERTGLFSHHGIGGGAGAGQGAKGGIATAAEDDDSSCADGGTLFGREKELDLLVRCQRKVASHVQRTHRTESNDPTATTNFGAGGGGGGDGSSGGLTFSGNDIDFHCEMAFISGYAGSGKSSLVRSLVRKCARERWFILSCKFETQVVPIKSIAKGFDDFFGAWADNAALDNSNKNNNKNNNNNNNNDNNSVVADPAMAESFRQVCRCLSSTIDDEGLSQLVEVVPNLAKVFPRVAKGGHALGSSCCDSQGASSYIKVGSANRRRLHLFHVMFKSICSAGRPVLIAHEDIHWARSMEGLKDFILSYADITCATARDARCHGLMIVGTYRSNEIGNNEGIVNTMQDITRSGAATITRVACEELCHMDVSKLIAGKLCLPVRYARELAGLVLSKTRGNPFFVLQFLKSIIQNRMLEYSLEHRRWRWDIDVIDMQMISDGVAELLSTRFNLLPLPLMQTAMVASCFGSQIDDSIIDLLNEDRALLPFDMQGALRMAIKEGIMEKAGPIYQFTHDLIQQTIYESILSSDQKQLHKSIGMILLKSAAYHKQAHYLLAVKHINKYSKHAILSQDERSQYAEINVTAAKFSIAESSFEQARLYVDVGMKLLGPQHWENQYVLSLKLYEMSASISCINGDTGNMSMSLNEIIANVKSFEDSLTSSILLAKLLAASSKFGEAMRNCLSVLSILGEEIPQDVTLQMVWDELSVIQTTLANISVEKVKLLPPMTDNSKLNAMKFLSMLCCYSIIAKPLLLPILSCRMVRLTIEHGFCDDSIVGLVTTGYGLFSFTDEARLGYRIGKVGEELIQESPNRHALRSRLVHELDGTLKAFVEPVHSLNATFHDIYNSALMSGDIDCAMLSSVGYCVGLLHTGKSLAFLATSVTACIKQSIKYQQNTTLFLGMSVFLACMQLTGSSTSEVDVKSYEELNEIGTRTDNMQLLHQNLINTMSCHFWKRDYMKVVQLLALHKPPEHKRTLVVVRVFFEGIASLNLARQTHQQDLRKKGELSLEKVLKWADLSTWNFENMALLLQAELEYLNGDLEAARAAYEASIMSARDHKYLHYEALAHELYGIFCLENRMTGEGMKQLHYSFDKYTQWGAMEKVKELQIFMGIVDPSYLRRELQIQI